MTGSVIESISLRVRVASSSRGSSRGGSRGSGSSSRNVCVCANVCLGINGYEAEMICLLFLMECFCLACDYVLTASDDDDDYADDEEGHVEASPYTYIYGARERGRERERRRRSA